MVEIPTLQTDRLVLRAATIDDWPEYCRLMTSDRSIHMGGPYSVEQSWGWFCQDVAQWQLFGLGSLMIEEQDGRFEEWVFRP